jgi:hypothetical protein
MELIYLLLLFFFGPFLLLFFIRHDVKVLRSNGVNIEPSSAGLISMVFVVALYWIFPVFLGVQDLFLVSLLSLAICLACYFAFRFYMLRDTNITIVRSLPEETYSDRVALAATIMILLAMYYFLVFYGYAGGKGIGL